MISSLELAKLCGVSQGTVDRALHNRTGISGKTKQKILEMAGKHGYQPHPAARELLTGKSLVVGAVIPHINSIFYMDLLAGIKKKISESGFKLLISQYDSKDELLNLLSDFSARRFCGVIIIPPVWTPAIPGNMSSNIKIISLLSPVSGKNTCFISPDEEQTGGDAVDFLTAGGRRRIAHFTYRHPEYYAVRMRTEGYSKAMLKHKLEPLVIFNDDSDFIDIVRRQKIDAIFCHNDWLAMNALQQLRNAGIKVPEQISILGVDNSPTFNSLFPELTTMDYPREWVAAETLKILTGKRRTAVVPRMNIISRKT